MKGCFIMVMEYMKDHNINIMLIAEGIYKLDMPVKVNINKMCDELAGNTLVYVPGEDILIGVMDNNSSSKDRMEFMKSLHGFGKPIQLCTAFTPPSVNSNDTIYSREELYGE